MDWINVKDQLPKESGWYKIKTPYGEFEAPFVSTESGKMVWVLPDESIVTHWIKKENGIK